MDDLSSASKHIDAAAIHGNSATIHYVRGNISGRKGFLDKALMHYDEALSLDASHIRARLNRTSVLMAMKEGRRVLDDCEILLDLAPSFTLARLRRAEGYMLLTEWENARDDLKMVLEAAPHHYQALTKLGACYLSLQRPERAESLLNEAIRLNPDYAPAWHQRGLLYLELKETDAAFDDFQAAIRCDANHLDSTPYCCNSSPERTLRGSGCCMACRTHHRSGQFSCTEATWRLRDKSRSIGINSLYAQHEVSPCRAHPLRDRKLVAFGMMLCHNNRHKLQTQACRALKSTISQ